MNWQRQQSRFLTAVSAVLGLALLLGAQEVAQEYKLKAAFIYNFARFIEWPAASFENDDAPFVIAVVGKDPYNGALEQAVDGKKVGGRRVEIKHFETIDKIGRCQILVVPVTDDESEASAVRKVANEPVLCIGESGGFCSLGGCIRFFTEDDKMRFEISTDAAEQAKLTVSSKLLKLAKIFRK
jgi:hypothetical protein